MLLRKVTYHNFRPFIGKQEILLLPKDSRPDANVTVILGDNTFGKSTFVLSFIWCLYGESRFARKEDILNKKVERNMRFGQHGRGDIQRVANFQQVIEKMRIGQFFGILVYVLFLDMTFGH